MALARDLVGAAAMLTGGDGLHEFVPGTDTKGLGTDKPEGGLLHPGWYDGFLFSQALTIGGGTGDVQRNIVGERVLGLPHDVDVTTGMSWAECTQRQPVVESYGGRAAVAAKPALPTPSRHERATRSVKPIITTTDCHASLPGDGLGRNGDGEGQRDDERQSVSQPARDRSRPDIGRRWNTPSKSSCTSLMRTNQNDAEASISQKQ